MQEIVKSNDESFESINRLSCHSARGQAFAVIAEEIRSLARRINSSAQEQAKGNRLSLKSVMYDNERMQELKNEASQHIAPAKQAVEAVGGVEAHITINAIESRIILEALTPLTDLTESYGGETIQVPEETVSNND